MGNRAQLLEDAREVHAQGVLRILTVPHLGMFVFWGKGEEFSSSKCFLLLYRGTVLTS